MHIFCWERKVVPGTHKTQELEAIITVCLQLFRSLGQSQSVTLILQDIDETPQELYLLYRQIVLSIMRSANIRPQDKDKFRRLFQWVSLANRTLTLDELRYAISEDTFSQTLDSRDDHSLGLETSVRYLSCGFLCANKVVRPWSTKKQLGFIVQFIHYSVQEYFLSGGGLGDLMGLDSQKAVRNTQLEIAGHCYQYISLEHQKPRAHSRHPLFDYSMRYLFQHAKDAGEDAQKDVAHILDWPTENCIVKILALDRQKNGFRTYSPYNPESLLHVAVSCDNPGLVASVLQPSPSLNINEQRGYHQWTPLHHADSLGNIRVIERLFDIERT